MHDLVIIGAGPAGISASLEAKRLGLNHVVLEKGLIGNTIYQYPVGLTVFSTPDELEFSEGALGSRSDKPTREELLSYYVRTVLDNGLPVRTEEKVLRVERTGERLFTVTSDRGVYECRSVLFAIGAMDHPRRLGVKGEDLPKVHHLFKETYPYVRKNAMVVGGGNSAGEAALFLARDGANAMLAIFRKDWENNDPKQGCIKYWVKGPLEEELSKECLNVYFMNRVVEITDTEIVLEGESGTVDRFANDVVFVLIGSDADLTLLRDMGVEVRESKNGLVPVYDPSTYETNVPGVYVAGHFTEARHIAGAINVPKKIVPFIAEGLRR